MMHSFKIDNRTIGEAAPCLIIAEMSANHGQDLEMAKKTIKAAKEAGADAIKLQTYTPDTITLDCDNEYFRLDQGTPWDGRTLYELYQEAYTPWEWHEELFRVAREEGLICFSSPFDETAVDLLEELDCPAYKIASFEVTHVPLIRYVASKGKPVIISTGVAGLSDIELAVRTCREVENEQLVLLKCTSAYPAPKEEAHLRTIPNLAETFGVLSGLSDHTTGVEVPVASIPFGAAMIEKHFILDPSIGGPDASFSLDPEQFKEMVRAVRNAEKAVGEVDYSMSEKKRAARGFGGRSVFIVKDVEKGELLSPENLRVIRPGYGLHPKHYQDLIGRKAACDISKGTPMKWEFLDRFE